MRGLKITLLAFMVFFSFYLTMWGLYGTLPSWMGGIAWLFLLVGIVREVIVSANELQVKKMDEIHNDLFEKIKRIKHDR